jgi:hypothetical protein
MSRYRNNYLRSEADAEADLCNNYLRSEAELCITPTLEARLMPSGPPVLSRSTVKETNLRRSRSEGGRAARGGS